MRPNAERCSQLSSRACIRTSHRSRHCGTYARSKSLCVKGSRSAFVYRKILQPLRLPQAACASCSSGSALPARCPGRLSIRIIRRTIMSVNDPEDDTAAPVITYTIFGFVATKEETASPKEHSPTRKNTDMFSRTSRSPSGAKRNSYIKHCL